MAKQNSQVFDKVIETTYFKKGTEHKRRLRVIVLRETEDAIVYIPMNGISRVDYERLKRLYESSELGLLTAMRDERLDNGRNALVTYKDLICTYNKTPQPPLLSDIVSTEKTGETSAPAREQAQSPTQGGDGVDGFPVTGQLWEGEVPPGWVRNPDGTIRPRKKPGPKPKSK